MNNTNIQQIFHLSYADFASTHYQTPEQIKAAYSIMDCKTGVLGTNVSQCSDCGHIEYHNNSCRNRNCPNCQAVKKEIWVDKRRAEVINSSYFHVVFTLPHELNPLQQPAYFIQLTSSMLLGNAFRIIRKPKISWSNTWNYPGSAYMESNP